MLELFCILAVAVYLVSKLDISHFAQARAQAGLPSIKPRASKQSEDVPAPRLAIEGTQRPRFRSTTFVKAFGVNPRAVHDIRIYAHFGGLEQFPAAVSKQLAEIYERGAAVGTEIMGILCHGRGLKEGEAIYFTLVDARPEPRVVAFVDKLRLA
jgi:hypothetical protein